MPSADPAAVGLRYHQLHRLGRSSWPRLALGAGGLVVGMLAVAQVVGGVYLGVGEPFGELDTDPLTPAGLAFVTISLALVVPLVVVTTRLAHELPGGWIASVAGRIRWRWLLTCGALAAVALVASVLVSLVLPETGGATFDGSPNDVTGRTVAFALIVLLLIPLQSAGEEYGFRGYLTQAFGGVVRGRAGTVVAIVVPALLFALAHGVQDPPVFIDRFAFGLVAGVLVIATGGLEAGIAMHVLNNAAFFGLTLAFGDIGAALAPVAGTWWLLPVTLVQSLGYLALVVWAGRRRGVEAATSEVVLEAKRPRV